MVRFLGDKILPKYTHFVRIVTCESSTRLNKSSWVTHAALTSRVWHLPNVYLGVRALWSDRSGILVRIRRPITSSCMSFYRILVIIDCLYLNHRSISRVREGTLHKLRQEHEDVMIRGIYGKIDEYIHSILDLSTDWASNLTILASSCTSQRQFSSQDLMDSMRPCEVDDLVET